MAHHTTCISIYFLKDDIGDFYNAYLYHSWCVTEKFKPSALSFLCGITIGTTAGRHEEAFNFTKTREKVGKSFFLCGYSVSLSAHTLLNGVE